MWLVVESCSFLRTVEKTNADDLSRKALDTRIRKISLDARRVKSTRITQTKQESLAWSMPFTWCWLSTASGRSPTRKGGPRLLLESVDTHSGEMRRFATFDKPVTGYRESRWSWFCKK